MHYFKKNLGDYYKKAGRLSILQHGVFNLLIDACYDREKFPTLDEAMDWTWASTPEEVQAVEFVLNRFFTLKHDVYVQKRVQEELDEYKQRAEKNRQIAIDRETKRAENSTKRAENSTKRTRVVNGSSPNHKPLTTNHKPLTKKEGGNPPNPPEKRKRFIPPSLDEVRDYKLARGSPVDPESFIDFYESKGWLVGKAKMKDWKAAFRNWEKREVKDEKRKRTTQQRRESYVSNIYDYTKATDI